MDPIKIIIFVAAFILLLLLGRKLSGSEQIHSMPLPPTPDPPPAVPTPAVKDEPGEAAKRAPALVGAELPFPLQLADVRIRKDGTYNRPEFLNYYFGQINLIAGPPNPTSFCDEFFLETRDPQDEHVRIYKYIIATPAGLQAEMERERLSALALGDQAIIVSRWDLTAILNAVVKDIIKTYGGWANYSGEHALEAEADE